jgi:hypothetical protein
MAEQAAVSERLLAGTIEAQALLDEEVDVPVEDSRGSIGISSDALEDSCSGRRWAAAGVPQLLLLSRRDVEDLAARVARRQCGHDARGSKVSSHRPRLALRAVPLLVAAKQVAFGGSDVRQQSATTSSLSRDCRYRLACTHSQINLQTHKTHIQT